jgi:hypothetical protein
MSQLKVNALVSYSGNTVTLGTSGDTINVASNVTFNTASGTLTLPSTIKIDTIQNTNSSTLITQTNTTTITLGTSGQTIAVASGATLSGTSLTGTANSLNAGIGVNQSWQSPSRSAGVTYTNSTGKPIMVAITYTNSAASTVQGLTINGVAVYAAGSEVGNGSGFSLIVPDQATYIILSNGGVFNLVTWTELR